MSQNTRPPDSAQRRRYRFVTFVIYTKLGLSIPLSPTFVKFLPPPPFCISHIPRNLPKNRLLILAASDTKITICNRLLLPCRTSVFSDKTSAREQCSRAPQRSKNTFAALRQVFCTFQVQKTYDSKRKTPFLGFFRNYLPSRRAGLPYFPTRQAPGSIAPGRLIAVYPVLVRFPLTSGEHPPAISGRKAQKPPFHRQARPSSRRSSRSGCHRSA